MSEILIVGAGAVGQVFGFYLHRGGQKITYFVKEKYLSNLKEGFTLHRVYSPKKIETYQWEEFHSTSELSELSKKKWDQVWLCISSDALRSEFTKEVLSALPSGTPVIGFQPGPLDRELLSELCPKCTVSMGTINFSSTSSPIVDVQREKGGLAFFVPPYPPVLFDGEKSVVSDAASSLSKGGLKAGVKAGAWEEMVSFGPLLITFVAGLELADWSLSSFFGDKELSRLTSSAARQSSIAVKKYFDKSASTVVSKIMTMPLVFNSMWRFFARMMPFDFEAFFRVHFSKVGAQTVELLKVYAELAEKSGLDSGSISELRERLLAQREGRS